MKECEAQLAALQKENFDLKCRVYLMERGGGVDGGQAARVELEVENESLRASLLQKQALLQQAGTAFAQLEHAYSTQLQQAQAQLQQARDQCEQLQLSLADAEAQLEAAATSRHRRSEDMTALAGLAFPSFGDYSREGSLAPSEMAEEPKSQQQPQPQRDIDTYPTQTPTYPTHNSSHNSSHDASHHPTTPVHINATNISYNSINNSVGQPHSPHHHATAPQPDSATVVPAQQADSMQQVAALQAALASERHTSASLSQQLDAVQPAISVKIQELEERDAIIERKTEQLEQQNKILVEIQITLDEKQKVIAELESSLESARREISALESARDEAGDLEIAQRELESVKRELAEVHSALAEAKASGEKLDKDYNKSCAALTGVMTELTAVRASNKRLSRKNGELLKELKETLRVMGERGERGLAEEENEHLWAELESVKSELQLEREKSREEQGLSELRDRLSAVQSELASKSGEVESLSKALAAARAVKTGAPSLNGALSVPVTVCVSQLPNLTASSDPCPKTGPELIPKPAADPNLKLRPKTGGEVVDLERKGLKLCDNCKKVSNVVFVSDASELAGLNRYLEESKQALIGEWSKDRQASDKALAALQDCRKVRDVLKQRLEDMSAVLEQILESAEDLELSRLSGIDVSCLQQTLDQSRLLSQTLDASMAADVTLGDASFNLTSSFDVSFSGVDVAALVNGFYEELHRRINAILITKCPEDKALSPDHVKKSDNGTEFTTSDEAINKPEPSVEEVKNEVNKHSTACQTEVVISAKPSPPSLGQISAARISAMINPPSTTLKPNPGTLEPSSSDPFSTEETFGGQLESVREQPESESEAWFSEPDRRVSQARMGRLSDPLSGSGESCGEREPRRYRCDGRCRVAGRLRDVVAALKAEAAAGRPGVDAERLEAGLSGLRMRLEEGASASEATRRQLEAALAAGAGRPLQPLCRALLSAQDTAQLLRERLATTERCEESAQRELDCEESSFVEYEQRFAKEEERLKSAEAALSESEERVLRASREKLALVRERDSLRSRLLSVQTQTSVLCQSLGVDVSSDRLSCSNEDNSPSDLSLQLLKVHTAVKQLQKTRCEAAAGQTQLEALRKAHSQVLKEFEDLRQKYSVVSHEEFLNRERLEDLVEDKRKEVEDVCAKFESRIFTLNRTIKALETKHSDELKTCNEKERRFLEELQACEAREKSFQERLELLELKSVEESRRLEERVRELGERRLSLCDSCHGAKRADSPDACSDLGLGSSVERVAPRPSPPSPRASLSSLRASLTSPHSPPSPRGCAVPEHRVLAAENGRLLEELQHARASLTEARGALARERGAKKSADKLICKELLKTYKVLDSTGKRAPGGSRGTEERLKGAVERTKRTEKSQDVLTPRNRAETNRGAVSVRPASQTARLSGSRSERKENESAQ